MSDIITAQEMRRRLIIFLRIPAEVWTDVLNPFSRQILVQKIAPVCFRLKEISDKNVKSVHVIENAHLFNDGLNEENPEAIEQLEHLAGNICQLAGQFRPTELCISEKSQAILLHCPDLFSGCQVKMNLVEKNKNSPLFLECLTQLEKAKPIEIHVIQDIDQVLLDFWHNPSFLNCTRVDLYIRATLSAATKLSAVEKIFEWLHHQPIGIGEDYNGPADRQVRSMIFWYPRIDYDNIDWLINRCSEDIQQARDPADHRLYVFNFHSWDWSGFGQFHPIENKSTGEMLLLDHVMNKNGQPSGQYRIRRCLIEEIANGPDYYAKLFRRDRGYADFAIEEKTTAVFIK